MLVLALMRVLWPCAAACADARARTYVLASRVCMLIRVLGPMFWHACSMPVQREGRAQLRVLHFPAQMCWPLSSADMLAVA